jgi:hypothetical protein
MNSVGWVKAKFADLEALHSLFTSMPSFMNCLVHKRAFESIRTKPWKFGKKLQELLLRVESRGLMGDDSFNKYLLLTSQSRALS